jgi:hypothetical protein
MTTPRRCHFARLLPPLLALLAGGLAAASPSQGVVPDFGPNVLVFEPSMTNIQTRIDAVFRQQERSQFGSNRFALLFTPGKYDLDVQVGFYTQVLGLGQSPDEVSITGAVRCKAHAQKDGAQAAEFQRALCERLRSLKVGGGRPVRLWVADEHRYGLMPVVRKCWALRGRRPRAPYQTKYQWGYLYWALEVDGANAAEFLCLPEVSLAMSRLFLERLAACDPQAEHVVIWDQAGFHLKAGLQAVPERVHLVELPPDRPELNPVEAIGDLIKDAIGNVRWRTLEELEAAIGEELRPIYETAERVRRLVSRPWPMEQANATARKNSALTC